MSPPVCGHALFWALHAEREVEDRHHNCRVLLEIYVRNSGQYRVAIGHQMFVVNKLTQVVTAVKEFCASKDEHGDRTLSFARSSRTWCSRDRSSCRFRLTWSARVSSSRSAR